MYINMYEEYNTVVKNLDSKIKPTCKAQHRDIANNNVATMYGVRWVLDLLG